MKRWMMIFLVGATLFNVQAGNIPLKGELEGGGIMKTPFPTLPVEAWQNDADVQLDFLVDLGALNVMVVADEAGEPVFQTTVKATAGSELNIDTGSWDAGEYTLWITDGLGGSLEGKFVIN